MMSKPSNIAASRMLHRECVNARILLLGMVCLLWTSLSIAMPNDPLGVRKALDLTDANATAEGVPAETTRDAEGKPEETLYSDTSSSNVSPVPFDYQAVPESDVFGTKLFSGAFTRGGATTFNPDYLVSIGDKVHVRLWGAFQFDSGVTVDAKGNIFLPNVGPIKLLGVRSGDVQQAVKTAVRGVYQKNVLSYANLEGAQPVRVFVGGFVRRPGLYDGTSMDSLLHYLDQAGGIDPDRGSFLDVQVKRGTHLRSHINLYDFLLNGTIPLVQFSDGDVIFVPPRRHTVKVTGLAGNPNRFEYLGDRLQLSQLISLAKPLASATNIRVIRNTGTVRNVEYFSLGQARDVSLNDGDEVEFVADKKPGTITVRVEGEHQSAQEYVLPYGTRMGTLISQIKFSERSDTDSLQLYRKSVKERQKRMLKDTLKGLESAVLTARSGTSDEASLRKDEAGLILQWVDRAKKIEPLGQVIIARESERNQLLLENGDIIRVPTRDGLVVVSGEVLFPTAIAYSPKFSLDDYIKAAGGYAQNADSSRVVLAHRDGTFEQIEQDTNIFLVSSRPKIRDGDEILVLPKIDVKSRQIVKDMSQILYQIAISAKVVLGL